MTNRRTYADDQLLLELVGQLIGEGKLGQRFYARAAGIASGTEAGKVLEELTQELGREIDLLRAQWRQLRTEVDAFMLGCSTRQVGRGRTGGIQRRGSPDPASSRSGSAVRLSPMGFYRTLDYQRISRARDRASVLKLALGIERRAYRYLSRAARLTRTRTGGEGVLRLANDRKRRYLWLKRKYERLAAA
jgi:hypothetical protein